MTTPVLTQKQQRKSLSAKKGPVKGLKNVLAQPNENYWPLLKNDNEAALENILKRLLPALKRAVVKIPWSEHRKMNKEERLAARKKAQAESNANYDEEAAKSIVFGVNAVTRMLEKDDACCILLDASVDPSLLVKHIVVMAKNKNVPVLLIPFLKKVTLETIGFASAATGLKKHVKESSENYFHALFAKVLELSSDLPNPRLPVALFQNENELDKSHIGIELMEQDIEIKKPLIVATDVYLYRSSKKQRVFKPPNSSEDKQPVKSTWSDYISLGDDEFVVDKKVPSRFFDTPLSVSDNINRNNIKKVKYIKTEEKTDTPDETKVQLDKSKTSYKPLKVKRLQGNPSRTKAVKPPKVKKK